ncbi:MAG: DNA internalization-related competence protein ComEC/Rec2 [Parasporobacterium sp.]|nr:DNA internalization-related competence protein ComEC/Rec2 [Parasporobacterium sp.]
MRKRPIFAAAVVLAIGVFFLHLFFPSVLEPDPGFSDRERIRAEGDVFRIEQDEKQVRIFLHHVSCGTSMLRPVRGSMLLTVSEDLFQDLDLTVGNRILAEGTWNAFRQARNFGNYEEAQYYASLGIFLRAKGTKLVITDRHTDRIRQFLQDFRQRMTDSIHHVVQDPVTAGILTAICTGDRSGLSEEVRNLYQRSGIIHILAVSGLHISLIGMTVFRLLRKRLRFPAAALICLFLMLGFCIMTSASASAVRATIMFLVQLAGIGLGKKYDILSSLSLAAILMLAENPLYLFHSAFQLSFAAMLAAGLLYPDLAALFDLPPADGYRRKDENNLPEKKSRKWKEKLLSSFLLSLSVTAMTLPITASLYYELPVYAVVLNLAVIPLMSVVLGAGMVSSLLGMISLVMGRFFCAVGVYGVLLIRRLCLAAAQLPLQTLPTGKISVWQMIAYYGILAVFVCIIRVRILLRRSSRSILPRRGSIFAGVFILMLIVLLAGKGTGRLRIAFIDVGQGDAILIENPSGSVYLIDGGSSSVDQVARYRLADAIRYFGISRIDAAVITHPDTDHISGVLELLEDMKAGSERSVGNLPEFGISIGSILIPTVMGNEHYDHLCDLANAGKVEVLPLHAGITISDGDLVMKCLHPPSGFTAEDVNDISAVLEIHYGAFSALMTGDLGEEGEQKLLSEPELSRGLNCDLLKVGHHGSRFSSSLAFLERVSPEIAVICAGKGNVYGHPHKETLDRLESVGALVYVTAQQGEIIVEADLNGRMSIRTKL